MEVKESKEPKGKTYYTIGEVADMFGLKTSNIRYWENEFSVLRPRKNKKGNRLFTQRDVRYLHIIYYLIKVKGFTIAGAKTALSEKFSKYEERVMTLEVLEKTKAFLLSIDKELEAKQASMTTPDH